MRRLLFIVFLLAAGCSEAPKAPPVPMSERMKVISVQSIKSNGTSGELTVLEDRETGAEVLLYIGDNSRVSMVVLPAKQRGER